MEITQPEQISKIIRATKDLIQDIDKGELEFRLSLNPPEYVSENDGVLKIEYSNILEISKNYIKRTITSAREDSNNSDV